MLRWDLMITYAVLMRGHPRQVSAERGKVVAEEAAMLLQLQGLKLTPGFLKASCAGSSEFSCRKLIAYRFLF